MKLVPFVFALFALPAWAGVLALRVDVEPSGGSFDEKPATRILGQTPGADVFAGGGNRGDWDLGTGATAENPRGEPLLLQKGVGIPSLNELVPQKDRGCLGVGSKLTTSKDGHDNDRLWVCGATAAGNGAEANYDFAFAFFPFAEGWIGGHVATDGKNFLVEGNLPPGTTIQLIESGSQTGEVLLRLPGIDSIEDGMLFTVPELNGDDVTAAAPLADGSGWYVRTADESHNFGQTQRLPFGFVFIPYGLPGMVGGRVAEDGSVLRASGDFAVRRVAGGRYEIHLPDWREEDGILLVEISKLYPDGVEDNAIAWAYDPKACNGRGGFVVESYDQPDFVNQDTIFSFAFIPYANDLRGERPSPPATFAARDTWADSMRAAREELARLDADTERFQPWFGPTMRQGAAPAEVSRPVRGVKRLWLVAESLDGNSGDQAAWGNPRFLLEDGTTLPLADANWLYDGVGHGQLEHRPVKLGETEFASGVFAHAPSAILVEVPENAMRFLASAGLDAGANDKASVRFVVTDRRDRLPPWRDTYRPVLQRQFPREMARLRQDWQTAGGLNQFQFAESEPRFAAGLDSLRAELGVFADLVPAAREDSLPELLAAYGQAVDVLDRLHAAREIAWEAVPELAELLDYPAFSQNSLSAKLERIRQEQPAAAPEIEVRQQLVAASDRECETALRAVLAGGNLPADRLKGAAKALTAVAEWADRSLGWTAFGGDNQRSLVSREVLPAHLRLAWTYQPLTPPAPAWPLPRPDNPSAKHYGLEPTLTYDRAYHPVLAENRAVFADHGSDAIVCLDAASGQELWRTSLEGPPRFAPAIAQGRVYAGCDDGYLYCLDFVSGRILWRYQPGDGDRRMVGNGRVVSQWPVRTGVCVDGGVVYLAAGLFPSLGTYLCAVDARDGRELWKEKQGISPQGYLLLSPTRLFVPTGRTPFRVFERATGKHLGSLGKTQSWGKDLPGGCSALVVNETLATGPGEGGNIHLFDVQSTETIVRTPGRALVVDGRTAFILRDREVAALNRDEYVRGQGLRERWTAPCPPGDIMLKVGDQLVVGGESGITVFAADSGEQVVTIPLPRGTIEGLAFHAGRLLVSMADGSIHCLAGGEGEATAAKTEPVPPPVSPKILAQARELADWGQFDQGWALVEGAAAAEFALALAQTSALRVIVAETDPAKADALRQTWAKSGLLGTRIAVHTVTADTLPYRPYLFNLVVAADAPAPELARVLRPLGGRLVARAAGTVALPGESLPPPAGFAFAFARGAVPGSGEWTHCYGDPGNTACSGDQLPFGDFAVLWYGLPGPRHMFQRHVKGAAPLYRNGTVFVNGQDYLAGVDAYNGALLWEKHLPGAGRMALLKDCGNMVAADDRLFVAVGGDCLVLAARTGEELARHPVAAFAASGGKWGYVAAWQDLLVGSATRDQAFFVPDNKEDYDTVWKHFKPVVTSLSIFGLNRADGTPRWRYEPAGGVILNPTLGIVDGLLCFVESTNPATREHETGKIPLADLFAGGPRLTALHAATGAVAWSVPIDLAAFHHAIYLSGKEGMIVLTGSRHDQVGEQRLIQYQMVGVSVRDGREVWRNDNTPSRAHILDGGHGEQTQHPTIVGDAVYGPGFIRHLRTGEEIKGWQWNKSPQCATVSSSANHVFSRQGGNPTIAELSTGKEIKLTRVTRPSCWINTLPVGGIVVIPEGSSGCTCGYSLQTSLALAPLP